MTRIDLYLGQFLLVGLMLIPIIGPSLCFIVVLPQEIRNSNRLNRSQRRKRYQQQLIIEQAKNHYDATRIPNSMPSTSSKRTTTELGSFMEVTRGENEKFQMYYEYRVPSSNNNSKLPVVMVHGGPGLPSDYLKPAFDLFHDRPILLYDQIGCGCSDMPSLNTSKYYSFELLARDLHKLIRHVFSFEETKFHLYGHSCGGIVVYEYLKRYSQSTNCQSVTLSSSPSDIPMTNQAWDELHHSIQDEMEIPDDLMPEFIDDVFQQRHVCRRRRRISESDDESSDNEDDSSSDDNDNENYRENTQPPKPLQLAYDKGSQAIWSGIDARGVNDYKVTNHQDELTAGKIQIPTLISRGQYDFVSFDNICGYQTCFEDITYVELKDCSHHGMLERPNKYKELMEDFWSLHDNFS